MTRKKLEAQHTKEMYKYCNSYTYLDDSATKLRLDEMIIITKQRRMKSQDLDN